MPVGQPFEQHRPLALVGAHRAHAEQASRRVEPAPALELGGQFTSRSSICAIVAAPGTSKRRAISCLRPSACSADAAMRRARARLDRRPAAAACADGDAGHRRAVNRQQLAAPRSAVGAEPDAVQRKAEDRSVHTVLGSDCGDVRVVMLHAARRDACVRANDVANAVLWKSGCRSCATASGTTSSTFIRCAAASSRARQVVRCRGRRRVATGTPRRRA